MRGLDILIRTLSIRSASADSHGNHWQYHSRGDRHSTVASWCVLLDLMEQSPMLVEHARGGKVTFGVNHTMTDWRNSRKKDLDLVLCRPKSGAPDAPDGKRQSSFKEYGEEKGVDLTEGDRRALAALPDIEHGDAGQSVFFALENKATMTSHVKARPRLYDELNSSHQTVHGDTPDAIAAGLVMINAAATFVSPDLNKRNLDGEYPRLSRHRQPHDASEVVHKVHELPRRNEQTDPGFDAIGIILVDAVNDGSPWTLHEAAPAPPPGDAFHYATMIQRIAQLYELRRR